MASGGPTHATYRRRGSPSPLSALVVRTLIAQRRRRTGLAARPRLPSSPTSAAGLATIYFLVLVPSQLGYYRTLPDRFPRLARCVDAFRESVNTFLNTALIFAVASGTLSFGSIQYRDMVMRLSGRSNEDDRWTFGQVLSLATWCPVLVDYAAVLIYGPERGLSERLSRRYAVVATKGSEEKDMSSKSLRYGRIDQLHRHDDRVATV
ncbi:hypothetical protein F4809DRAFT_664158 [Biscogniauxia mediterranea]|nr:hypothetical protein F4809DRAFT_664158 [Biscogniauxia mediterranea]